MEVGSIDDDQNAGGFVELCVLVDHLLLRLARCTLFQGSGFGVWKFGILIPWVCSA